MKMRLAWLGVVDLVLLVGRSEASSCSAHAGLAVREQKMGEGRTSPHPVREGHLTFLQCPLTPKENINWFWDASDFLQLRKPNSIKASFGEYWETWRHVRSWVEKGKPLFHLGPDWADGDDCRSDERLSDGRVFVHHSDRSLFIRWAMPPDNKFLCMDGANPENATSAHFFDLKVLGCIDARSGQNVTETCWGPENSCHYELKDTPMRKVACTCDAQRTGEFCDKQLKNLWFFPLVSTVILLYYGFFLTVAAIRPMRLERVSLEDVGGADAERISVAKFLEAESRVPLFRPSMIPKDGDSETSEEEVEVKVDEKGPATVRPDNMATGKSITPTKLLPKVEGSIHVRGAPTESRLYTTSPAPTYKDAEAIHLSTNPEPQKPTGEQK